MCDSKTSMFFEVLIELNSFTFLIKEKVTNTSLVLVMQR